MTITAPTPSGLTMADLGATPTVRSGHQFLGERLPAFLGVAKVDGIVARESMSVQEALVEAGLNFTVSLHEGQTNVPIAGGGTLTLPQEGHWSTVRSDPDGTKTFFGVVRSRYKQVQNTDAFAFGQHLIDDFGANVAAAAGHGKPIGVRTFLGLRLSETLNVAGQDPHDLYLLIGNSHNGDTGVTAAIVPIRRANMGEVVTSIPTVPQRWTLRHSGDVGGKMAEAIHTHKMVKSWMATYQRLTYELLGTRMSVTEFEQFTHRLLPTPRNAGKRSAATWAERRRLLVDLFSNAPTTSFGRGTRYAAVCAVNEYLDHFAATRGGDPKEVRYARNLAGQSVRTKELAWNLLAAC
ncbi:MAG: DUF945 domain-containing protein [Nocardioides sp.]|nr:DUF945 domain-containing protein [Nocardioides sp.]